MRSSKGLEVVAISTHHSREEHTRKLLRTELRDHYHLLIYLFTYQYLFIFQLHYYFPALLVGGFTLNELIVDKPWSQVSTAPPRYVPLLSVAHRVQLSHCSSIFIECSYLTLSRFPLVILFFARKSHEHALGDT